MDVIFMYLGQPILSCSHTPEQTVTVRILVTLSWWTGNILMLAYHYMYSKHQPKHGPLTTIQFPLFGQLNLIPFSVPLSQIRGHWFNHYLICSLLELIIVWSMFHLIYFFPVQWVILFISSLFQSLVILKCGFPYSEAKYGPTYSNIIWHDYYLICSFFNLIIVCTMGYLIH